MSGGSYDYIYARLNDLADEIRGDSPERDAFREHLRLVAKAMHDIEWVDSYDMGPGDENAAILACVSAEAVTDTVLARLKAEIARAEAVLSRAGSR